MKPWLLILCLVGWWPIALAADAPTTPKPRARVVLIEHPSCVQKFSVDSHEVASMFNQALLAWTGQPDVASAWSKGLGIVPSDVVGIKITTAGGPLLSTHRPLIEAISQGLVSAGVSPGNIVIWDKFEDDMMAAGFPPFEGGATQASIRNVVPQTKFDPGQFYVNEVLGKLIWGDLEFRGKRPSRDDLLNAAQTAVAKKAKEQDPNAIVDAPPTEDQTSNKSYFANLVSKTCTKIINVPVLTDNGNFGLNGCLSTLAIGSVDNTRRFQGEDIHGDPAIPEILDHDWLRKKIVLHVLDSLVAEYAGGPGFSPQFTQGVGALYISTDPVAIDTLALKKIEAWRDTAKVPPLKELASHVKSASSYNLGESDPKKIDVVHLP